MTAVPKKPVCPCKKDCAGRAAECRLSCEANKQYEKDYAAWMQAREEFYKNQHAKYGKSAAQMARSRSAQMEEKRKGHKV